MNIHCYYHETWFVIHGNRHNSIKSNKIKSLCIPYVSCIADEWYQILVNNKMIAPFYHLKNNSMASQETMFSFLNNCYAYNSLDHSSLWWDAFGDCQGVLWETLITLLTVTYLTNMNCMYIVHVFCIVALMLV